MGNTFGLFSSYYLIKDLLEINKCIDEYPNQEYNQDNYKYLKNLVIKNGCVTIKLLQWYISHLRRKSDKNIKDFCKYFEDIFDQCPYHNLKNTETLFENNFGFSIYDLIEKDTLETIASGSIGQVYKGKLINSSSWIAIKIKHPNIDQDVKKYSFLLKIISWLQQFEYFDNKYYFQHDLNEFLDDLAEQLDFTIESRNASKFRQLYKDNPMVYVPKILNYTKDIIISEYVETIDFYDLSDFNKYKCAINLNCFMQETTVIHNFIHADLHCKNWQAKKLDDNNYQLVIFDCALVSSVDDMEGTKNIWKIFEACDLNEFEEYNKLLINMVKNNLIETGELTPQIEDKLSQIYKKYLSSNLDFSFLGHEILELVYENKFIVNKSFSSVFMMITILLEFLYEADLANNDSSSIKNRSSVIRNNLYEALNFCQVTNSYPLLQENLNKRLDLIKDKNNTISNLFSDLQRNELTFGSIDDSDDEENNYEGTEETPETEETEETKETKETEETKETKETKETEETEETPETEETEETKETEETEETKETEETEENDKNDYDAKDKKINYKIRHKSV